MTKQLILSALVIVGLVNAQWVTSTTNIPNSSNLSGYIDGKLNFQLSGTTGCAAVNGTIGKDVCTDSAGKVYVPSVSGTPATWVQIPTLPLLQAQVPSSGFGVAFGSPSNSSALTAGGTSTAYLTIPKACTINGWNITVDAGTITFDVWKIATGTAIPTISNTIVASAFPALASGTAVHSTTLTGWTTAVAANDIVGINIKTVATAKYASLIVGCQ